MAGWDLEITKPGSLTFDLVIRDQRTGRAILRTSVYRAEDADGAT
jgi:hypothetical protein